MVVAAAAITGLVASAASAPRNTAQAASRVARAVAQVWPLIRNSGTPPKLDSVIAGAVMLAELDANPPTAQTG